MKPIPPDALHAVGQRRALHAFIADAVPRVRHVDCHPPCIIERDCFGSGHARWLAEAPPRIQGLKQAPLLSGGGRGCTQREYGEQHGAGASIVHSFLRNAPTSSSSCRGPLPCGVDEMDDICKHQFVGGFRRWINRDCLPLHFPNFPLSVGCRKTVPVSLPLVAPRLAPNFTANMGSSLDSSGLLASHICPSDQYSSIPIQHFRIFMDY